MLPPPLGDDIARSNTRDATQVGCPVSWTAHPEQKVPAGRGAKARRLPTVLYVVDVRWRGGAFQLTHLYTHRHYISGQNHYRVSSA